MKKVELFIYSFVALMMILCLSVSVQASLVDNNDGTITQYRSDGSILMWLKDANYANTTGYDDALYGVNTDGRMIWGHAIEWADSLVYAGYDDWQLPITLPVNGSTYNYNWDYDGSTDRGYNISAVNSAYPYSTSSDLSYMYYAELGNLGYYDTSANPAQSGWGLTKTGPFTNLQASYYWSETEYSPDTERAWRLGFEDGAQNHNFKSITGHHAWAVRVVPEPISSILFITGGTLLAGKRYFK